MFAAIRKKFHILGLCEWVEWLQAQSSNDLERLWKAYSEDRSAKDEVAASFLSLEMDKRGLTKS